MPVPKSREYTADDYWNLPEGDRAELIAGELYDMAPPSRTHQRIALGICRSIASYIDDHDGPCEVDIAPFAVNLAADDSTYVEPDVLVVCDPAKLTERGCVGAPDLVVEVVSPSSERMDYLTKCDLYNRAGVREYWIVDPKVGRTTVYRFEAEGMAPRVYDFASDVPVGIYGDLSVKVAGLL